jgi:hypothetical protein
MNIIIDTEVIKDLIENEWGYEGIRDDLDEIFEKNGTPLDKIKGEIDLLSDSECNGTTVTIYSWNGMKKKVFEIIDRYRKTK